MGSWRSLSRQDDHRRLPFISSSAALQPLICSKMTPWKYLGLSSAKNWYGVEIWFTFWKSRLDTKSAKEHTKYRRWYRALCALRHHPSTYNSLCVVSEWILVRITWCLLWKLANSFGLYHVVSSQIGTWEWWDRCAMKRSTLWVLMPPNDPMPSHCECLLHMSRLILERVDNIMTIGHHKKERMISRIPVFWDARKMHDKIPTHDI